MSDYEDNGGRVWGPHETQRRIVVVETLLEVSSQRYVARELYDRDIRAIQKDQADMESLSAERYKEIVARMSSVSRQMWTVIGAIIVASIANFFTP